MKTASIMWLHYIHIIYKMYMHVCLKKKKKKERRGFKFHAPIFFIIILVIFKRPYKVQSTKKTYILQY